MSKVDLVTVLVSALASTAVAAAVSLAVNLVLGGRMEVRKLRAVRRYETHRALDESLRLQLNVVRQLLGGQTSYSTRDGVLVAFSDGFDELFDEMQQRYRDVRKHIAATDGIQPEEAVGQAMFGAGVHIARVNHFRKQAVGESPEAFMAASTLIRNDLATAHELLTDARSCLDAGFLTRRWHERRLSRRLAELELRAEAGRAPETPLNYNVALSTLGRESR